ncbi:MAG: hypothetical protein IKJ69_03620 [Clostridia bacterium]|nr:hypothetical protein [Clostridia bacterium]
MTIEYKLTNDILLLDDGFIPTYGIQASDTESGDILSCFNDVSVNKDFTQQIVDLLNLCKVDLCHFYDVVVDELNR